MVRGAADAGRRRGGAASRCSARSAALRLEPDAGTDPLVDSGSATYRRDPGLRAQVRRRRRSSSSSRATSTSSCSPRDLGKLLALEGCLSGNVEGGKVFTDRPAPAPCAALAASRAGAGGARRRRPSSTSPRSRRPTFSRASRRPRSSRRARPPRRRSSAPAARASATEQQQAAANAAAAGGPDASSGSGYCSSRSQYGQTGLPRLDDPTFVSAVVFDPARPGARRSRASAICLPELRRRADLDPAAARTSASRSAARRSG